MYKLRKLHKNDEGQSLVEFALVLPVLLFIILGMIEFGWILNAEISMTSAAREGARIAIVTRINPDGKVQEAVENALEETGIYDVKGEYVKLPFDTINNINNVVVTASGTIDPIVGLFLKGPQTIDAKATMRVE